MYPVFIPTKGRFARRRKIVDLCLESGHYPTLVVEEQELSSYQKTYSEDVLYSVLPDSGRGIAFARNFILDESVKRSEPIWMIDDDITSFVQIKKDQRFSYLDTLTLHQALSFVEDLVHQNFDKNVFVAGMKFRQMLREVPKTPITFNRHAVCVVLLNGPICKVRYRDDFRICEDGLFNLENIIAGRTALISNEIGFSAPTIGASGKGGLEQDYQDGSYIRFTEQCAEMFPQFVSLDFKEEGARSVRCRFDWKAVDRAHAGNAATMP